ncbi:MAG TPA: hypothetical protein VHU84_08665 [Lacipirellulaceae bacterium]|nr:hypothetical protein [Lacipirellulaceae bacterium]
MTLKRSQAILAGDWYACFVAKRRGLQIANPPDSITIGVLISGENGSMRKRIIGSVRGGEILPKRDTWLDLEQLATIEVSSEDPHFPVESIFDPTEDRGWRAGQDGEQLLRIIFDESTRLHRMQVLFVENETERTQEFTIRWSPERGGPTREIVRQQWTFSPKGSTREVEQYDVDLDGVAVLELSIKPDLNAGRGRATLLNWRVA